MTEQDYATLSDYITTIARALGLGHWSIRLSEEAACSPDAYAEVNPTDQRFHVVIRVCRDFRSLTPQIQRESIVHELLHLPYQPAVDVIRLDLWEARALSQSTYDALYKAFSRQMEYATDCLAGAVARLLPCISWEGEA